MNLLDKLSGRFVQQYLIILRAGTLQAVLNIGNGNVQLAQKQNMGKAVSLLYAV
ncbi:hypothetical protein D3C75_1386800 [compost metagenome]